MAGYSEDNEMDSSCCNKDCCWITGLIAVILGMLLIMIIAISIPDPTPKFRLEGVTITQPPFTVTNSTITTGRFNLNFWIANTLSGYIDDSLNVSVYYHGRRKDHYLSSTVVHSFCDGHYPWLCYQDYDDQTRMFVAVPAASVPSSDDSDPVADAAAGLMSLTVKVEGDYTNRLALWGTDQLRVACDNVTVTFPSGDIVGGPKHCEVHWSANIFDKWFRHHRAAQN